MVIGLLIVDTIFVQVVLLSMGSYLCCFEGEHPCFFNQKESSSDGGSSTILVFNSRYVFCTSMFS